MVFRVHGLDVGFDFGFLGLLFRWVSSMYLAIMSWKRQGMVPSTVAVPPCM